MSAVSETCKTCSADLGEFSAIYTYCDDCEAERQRRGRMRISLILMPVWMPIEVVGLVVGLVGALLARGFRDGLSAVRAVEIAWKGPKSRKTGSMNSGDSDE